MSCPLPSIVTFVAGSPSPFAASPHWVGEINGIIVAVAEEVVIAGIEELRVFAHEPPSLDYMRGLGIRRS